MRRFPRTGRMFSMIIGILLLLLSGPVGLSHAGTIVFSEDFNSASGTNPWTDVSERWNPTIYYLDSGSTTAAGWTFSGQALVAQNGNNLGDMAILLNEAPPASMVTLASAPISVSAGTSYLLTFDHWGDNRPGAPGYEFTVGINGSTLSTISRIYTVPGPGVTESFLFTPSTDAIFLSFSMTPSAEASPIIDNIRISMVPEPGTLILLGSGILGLALASRKKSRK
jgi:hypothetical protein